MSRAERCERPELDCPPEAPEWACLECSRPVDPIENKHGDWESQYCRQCEYELFASEFADR